jgi:hypothetical protein
VDALRDEKVGVLKWEKTYGSVDWSIALKGTRLASSVVRLTEGYAGNAAGDSTYSIVNMYFLQTSWRYS